MHGVSVRLSDRRNAQIVLGESEFNCMHRPFVVAQRAILPVTFDVKVILLFLNLKLDFQ